MRLREFARIGTTDVRIAAGIILLGLVWEFSAEIQTFISQIAGHRWQQWFARLIGELGPWLLTGAGVFWITLLRVWPALRRWLWPHPLAIVYEPQTHTSVRRRNIRDYCIELRNRAPDRTISDVIATWDETAFTRFIDEKLSRDWLLSPTAIAPSSSVSILLFSLEDDLPIAKNKNDVLGLTNTFTVRVSAKGLDDLTARFRYEPDRFPKLRKLWR
jgi:hypothetical protein